MRCVCPILGFCLLCLVSCHEPTAEEAAKGALREALEALGREDYDAYMAHVDFDMPMDSAQRAVMRDVLRQHLGWRHAQRARVVSVDLLDARMRGDSVCTVYYQYTFADSTKEAVAQKMVRNGAAWKLRLRN